MSQFEVEDLRVRYGKIEAVHGLTMTVPAGAIVTIIGPNGAGKSSSLNALAGLLPSTGRLRFDGQDIASLSTEERLRRGICLVPERRELFASLSIEDNLRLGAYVRSRERGSDAFDTLQEVFDRFPRLRERRRQLAGTLSGGERQLLALGRALMAKPKLLMLDEPSLGLAPRIVRDIFHIVLGLKQSGISILLVEQNARAALQIADYAYVLEMGSTALEGESHVLASEARIVESYLGLAKASHFRKKSPSIEA